MKDTNFNIEPALSLLNKHKEHKTPYRINFRGLELIINPEVFNPNYTKVTSFLAESIEGEFQNNRTCLDMFTGSGVLSLLAAKQGCRALGIDFSEKAIDCAKINARNLGFNNCEFRQGDVWQAVKDTEKFDLIMANPPLLPAWPETRLEAAIADSPEMLVTKRFISGLRAHLNPEGKAYMANSTACELSVGNSINFFAELAKKSGLNSKVRAELNPGYEVYRIFEFSPAS